MFELKYENSFFHMFYLFACAFAEANKLIVDVAWFKSGLPSIATETVLRGEDTIVLSNKIFNMTDYLRDFYNHYFSDVLNHFPTIKHLVLINCSIRGFYDYFFSYFMYLESIRFDHFTIENPDTPFSFLFSHWQQPNPAIISVSSPSGDAILSDDFTIYYDCGNDIDYSSSLAIPKINYQDFQIVVSSSSSNTPTIISSSFSIYRLDSFETFLFYLLGLFCLFIVLLKYSSSSLSFVVVFQEGDGLDYF